MMRPTHPTARALFDAHDLLIQQQQEQQQSENEEVAIETQKRRSLVQKQTQTCGWRSRHSQSSFYPVTVDGRTFSVAQKQRGEVEGTYGTGATVWPASMVLLKYFEQQQQQRATDSILKKKTVVDLGSGTGVLSIAAAVLGAKRVICTDGCASVVNLARENVLSCRKELFGQQQQQPYGGAEKRSLDTDEGNQCIIKVGSCDIQVREYSWGDGSLKNELVDEDVDVVLVSDCVLPKLYPIEPLVDALAEICGCHTQVYLSYEHRYFAPYNPKEKFLSLAEKRGFVVRTIQAGEQHPIFSADDIEVWHMQRTASR